MEQAPMTTSHPLHVDVVPYFIDALQMQKLIQTIAPTSILGTLLEKSHFVLFVYHK